MGTPAAARPAAPAQRLQRILRKLNRMHHHPGHLLQRTGQEDVVIAGKARDQSPFLGPGAAAASSPAALRVLFAFTNPPPAHCIRDKSSLLHKQYSDYSAVYRQLYRKLRSTESAQGASHVHRLSGLDCVVTDYIVPFITLEPQEP